MFWTKNKEDKKAGTTLIGISYNGHAALGTDFNPKKPDGEEVGIVKSCSKALIGFTGHGCCSCLTDNLIEHIDSCGELATSVEKIAASWEAETQLAEVGGCLVALDCESAYLIGPGKTQLVETGIVAVGPGEDYALAAIRAILAQPEMKETVPEIVEKAFKVASGVCVLVNSEATVVSLD